jgi:hypothetical protein
MKKAVELLESIDIDKLAEYSAKEVTDAIVDFPLRDLYKDFFKEGFNKAIELIKKQEKCNCGQPKVGGYSCQRTDCNQNL